MARQWLPLGRHLVIRSEWILYGRQLRNVKVVVVTSWTGIFLTQGRIDLQIVLALSLTSS